MFLDDDGNPFTLDVPAINNQLPRPNPETSGIRYMMSKHGRSIRTSWPLPPSSEKSIDEKGSCDGCKKVRYHYQGHRQRIALWVYMCMEHQTIVGFHVMPDGEGRRDGVIPPYRFMETPPAAIFGDYVCGWEETSLNYIPEFYCKVQFSHDVFHGCTHHWCSERFQGRRFAKFASLNTSLMEQVHTSNLRVSFLYTCNNTNSYFSITDE